MNSFDVVVIGSGPGGYVSAIRCAQLGMKTAIIEKYSTMGGTCLNVGCIPSKALLDSSHHYEEATKNFSNHGINIEGEISLDFGKMISRKNDVVSQTTKGIDFLMNKNNITVFNGFGSFVDQNKVKITLASSEEIIESKNIIIATGSKPSVLPFAKVDKDRIITSTEALKLKEIPKHLIIIGGGVIGLELGQVYKRLGSEVSILEYMDRIIPTMDSGLSKELTKVFKKQKFKIHTSHKVTSVERIGDNIKVIKAFSELADKLSEDEIIKGDGSEYMTAKDLEKEINELTQEGSAYWSKTHPNHNKAVQEVLKLREMLNG